MRYQPKISIILAFLDPGPAFKLAIQSVFAQTFTHWELILVDDGSTDGSLDFARALNDPRVRVFSDGMQRNLNYRLNQMIDLAEGEYIARMDADDVMHPERLERQYALLQKHPDNTVVGSSAWSIDVDDRVVGLRPMRNRQSQGLRVTQSFIHPSVTASAAWFRRYRYSNSFIFHRSQDADLWLRSSPESQFLTIEDPLLFYRELGNFSFEKYTGTQLGLIALGHRSASTRPLQGLAVITIASAKLWITAVASILGVTHVLIRRRSTAMTSAAIMKAESVLDQVRSAPLPVHRNTFPMAG